jgi:hypothetical protein
MRIPYLKFLGYSCMVLYFIIVLFLHVYLDTNESFGIHSKSSVERAHYLTLFPGQMSLRNRNDMSSGKAILYIMITIFVLGEWIF